MRFDGEQGYLDLLKDVQQQGTSVSDRTGVGTYQFTVPTIVEWPLWWGFPCLTTKKVFWKGAIAELIWMARGSTNVFDLSEILYGDRSKPNFWTPNYENQAKALGYSEGEMGPIYGKQLVDFNGVNQLQYIIDELKTPNSRRAVISLWNPSDLDKMTLPPCHYSCVFNRNSDDTINMSLVMRSNDLFLGAPFNYVFYAALLECICIAVDDNVSPGIYSHISINSHIYKNQLEQVNEQVTRTPTELPTLKISDTAKSLLKDLGAEAFHYINLDDFEMIDYNPQGKLTAPIAI